MIFQTKLEGMKGTGSEWLDKATKKDFTVNKPKEDKDQTLACGVDGDKWKWVREDIILSRSSISKSETLPWKLKFQEKE